MTGYELPTTDDRLIWDTWLSIHYLPAVTVADELGIFKALHEAPATAEDLAARLGYDLRALRATLSLLAARGFLAARLGVYQLTDSTRLYLLRDSPYYWGHMLGTGQPQHARLRDWLQGQSPTGVPGQGAEAGPEGAGAVGNWASGQIDLERSRQVAARMHSHSIASAIGMARNGDFVGVRRLLDVGGGSGCFAIALALEHPELRCTVMELPAMCEAALEYIRDGGAEDRVDTAAVDMFREPWPTGYDAMFFSNIFHDWNFETCAFLARRSFDTLTPGGRIYLHEMLLDDGGNGPVTTASFSMLMLGTQGQQFTFAELKQLLETAGFAGIETRHSYGYYSLVVGRKL